MKKILILLVCGILICGCSDILDKDSREILYVGTFSERGSKGLYVFEFIRDSLKFNLLQTLPGQISPSFLDIHPSKKYLYVVQRKSLNENKDWGSVSSFSVKDDGTLELINQYPSYGADPCHISIDHTGKYAFVSNYNGGNVAVFGIAGDGSLSDSLQTVKHSGSSINTERQKKAHVHSAIVSHDNRFVYVADLGTDKIMIYRINTGPVILTPSSPPWAAVKPGSGPRHFTIHPTLNTAYLAEELSSAASVFEVDTLTGSLTEIQRLSTLPESFMGINTNADIHTSPDGKFLYVSNRGDNSLVIYSIDQKTGMIQNMGFESVQGDWPRNFMIDPTGDYLMVANRKSDNIIVFSRNMETGKLSFMGDSIHVPGAVCLKMLVIE